MTPYIVAPGKWTQSDLKYHAETVAAALTHNASHNCLAAEVLVLDKDWPQREAFLDALRCEAFAISNVSLQRRRPFAVAAYMCGGGALAVTAYQNGLAAKALMLAHNWHHREALHDARTVMSQKLCLAVFTQRA